MSVSSGVANGEVFLQGKYLSIGINVDGTLGTMYNAAKGIETDIDTGLRRVGLFADFDGFGQGKETTLNDVLLQGRAIEGFNVGYKLDGDTVVRSNQKLTGYSQIKGSLDNASTSETAAATWSGATADKLGIAQKITLADDAKYIRIDVTLTNNSSVTMNDVRYMRTADPDQSDKFATANKIERQGDNGALVTAQVAPSTPFFLYTPDQRAVASFYGFVNTDPYAAAAYATEQAVGYAKTVDQTLNLTFGLGALKPGESTKITMYLGVTDNLGATLSQIDSGVITAPRPPVPVNLAPIVAADSFSGGEGSKLTGNVLKNDSDPEGGALTAKVKSGPANGTIEFSADGSFIYTPKAGFSGSDSFLYVASDGVNTSSDAVVRLTVEKAPVVPVVTIDPLLDLLKLPDLVNGSSSAAQVLTGVDGSNVFYFASAATTGNDRITNFGHSDLLVVDTKLYDGNNDGIIALSGNKVSIDAPKVGDFVQLDGVNALRFLGTDVAGHSVYGDAAVRPKGAKEGTFADNAFNGDTGDKAKNVFFFDTGLGLDLGDDSIGRFGKRDLVVTTSKLADGNNDGIVTGVAGKFGLPDDTGSILLKGTTGTAVDSLEFDGSILRDGVTYYVYSLVGTTGTDTADIGF